MRKAIIDMGSNTFHLLIADVVGSEIHHIYHEEYPAQLGKGSFRTTGVLTEQAMERGLSKLKEWAAYCRDQNVETTRVFATSAMRDAKNSPEYKEAIRLETGFIVEVISGDQEASYIFKGVQRALAHAREPYLIMDIGGGSTEFIVVKDNRVMWQWSYNLGAVRLLEQFHPSDPVNQEEVKRLLSFLDAELHELFQVCEAYEPQMLVGSSGAFESLRDMLLAKEGEKGQYTSRFDISYAAFNALFNELLPSTRQQREHVEGLVNFRVDTIVFGVIFIKFICETLGIENIVQTDYALKEGAV